MAIPSLVAFQQATAHKHKSKFKTRGRIHQIDDALVVWHQVAHGTDQELKLAAAYALFKECKKWIKAKQKEIDKGKGKSSTILRMQQVENLLEESTQCLNALVIQLGLGHAFDRFEGRKLHFGAHNGAKSLHGVYQHERDLYVHYKKQRAPSATRLNNMLPFHERSLKTSSFQNLSRRKYQKLDELTKRKEDVLYFNEIQRLKYMAFVVDGRLVDVHDQPVTTKSDLGEPYAMDRYGNLFLMDSVDEINGQVNHSSFNAGRPVICAGLIWVEDGLLTRIDNTSGHYKPTQRHLHDALTVLADQDADLTETMAVVLVMVEKPVKDYGYAFTYVDPAEVQNLSGITYKLDSESRAFAAIDLLNDPDCDVYEVI